MGVQVMFLSALGWWNYLYRRIHGIKRHPLSPWPHSDLQADSEEERADRRAPSDVQEPTGNGDLFEL